MVEENTKSFGGAGSSSSRLDVDSESGGYPQMGLLRTESMDTNKRLTSLHSTFAGPPPPVPTRHMVVENYHKNSNSTNGLDDKMSQAQLNGIVQKNNCHSADDSCLNLDNLSPAEMKREFERMLETNQNFQKELKLLRTENETHESGSRIRELHSELEQANASLSTLKADRKRLKAEKSELLNQMKQLYVTLEDKEKELRDFIRNHEMRVNETEGAMERLVSERDEAERERRNIIRHARNDTERGLALAAQVNIREAQVQQIQEELYEAKRQLSQYGIYSEPSRSSSATNANSHYSLVSNLTATYATPRLGAIPYSVGDRGSWTDSGVRLSSDRDSADGLPNTGNLSDSPNEELSLDLSGDGDSMSILSTATLPQLFGQTRGSPAPQSFTSLTRSMDANTLSRSAEQLLAAEAMDAVSRRGGRRSGAGAELGGRLPSSSKGAWGSISRVFSRNKPRRVLEPSAHDAGAGLAAGQRSSWSPQSSVSPSPLAEHETYSDKLRSLEEAATLPMELWRAGMVQAWIEVSLGMPQYGSRCGDNIRSGKVLLELSDPDLETELGISYHLHRKKLRLAIEEHRNPALVRFPCIVELSHVWVSSEWLPDIGLPQYAENFAGGLVDARLLDHLSKRDLEKYLGVTRKFHLASIAHGVHLLRIVAYDRQGLAERRRNCEDDPLVWTNEHFIQWAKSIELNEYADNLKGTGVHGALAVLEPTFNGDTLASSMRIPPAKQILKRRINIELEAILTPARATITQQFRVTKQQCRGPVPTLEKQRSDSLGRADAANAIKNGAFRTHSHSNSTSTEENTRRTSLRFSTWRSSQGSLSRALGLKMKQEIPQDRQLGGGSGKSRESTYANAQVIPMPIKSHQSPPPLPPNHPGKFMGGSASTIATYSNMIMTNGSEYSPQHFPRPQSSLSASASASASPSTSASTSASLSANSRRDKNRGHSLLSFEKSRGPNRKGVLVEEELPGSRNSSSLSEVADKYGRVVDSNYLPIHTPV